MGRDIHCGVVVRPLLAHPFRDGASTVPSLLEAPTFERPLHFCRHLHDTFLRILSPSFWAAFSHLLLFHQQ